MVREKNYSTPKGGEFGHEPERERHRPRGANDLPLSPADQMDATLLEEKP